MQILLVESDSGRTQELTSVFTDLNYEVLHLGSQKGAKEACETRDVRVVLASVDGEANGFELCAELKKEKKTQGLPVVLMGQAPDAKERFLAFEKKGGQVEAFIQVPTPSEDIVDHVETLIGLPEPPEALGASELSFPGSESLSVAPDGEVLELRREVESLQEQINFYQKQLEQLSMSGEKESHEMDNVLHELQEDLEKEQKAKSALQDELTLLKSDLQGKDQEAQENETKRLQAQEALKKETERLNGELEALRATFNESNEKHKKAQAALREYYKPKVAKMKKLQKTVSSLEESISENAEKIKALKARAEDAEKEVESLKSSAEEAQELQKEVEELRAEVLEEREKSQKAKDALKKLKEVFE